MDNRRKGHSREGGIGSGAAISKATAIAAHAAPMAIGIVYDPKASKSDSEPETQTEADINLPQRGCRAGQDQPRAAHCDSEQADCARSEPIGKRAAHRAGEIEQRNCD